MWENVVKKWWKCVNLLVNVVKWRNLGDTVALEEHKGIKDGVCVEMAEVKKKLEALVAYMREAFVRSPWNYANISSYDKVFKDMWWQYTAEIEAMCAVADGLDATTAARLELMSKSRCLEVEYDGSGDPYAGSQTYTPTKTAWNLDKHHIMMELRACAELVKNRTKRVVDVTSTDAMASARFLVLKTQVDGVRDMLARHEQVLGVVQGVQASLAKGYTGYTGAVRGDVGDELETAERLLSNVFTKAELLRSVKQARDWLEQTRAVNAPGAGGAVDKAATDVPQELDMSQLLRRMQDVCE